tara:strand:- start:167 stop:781 length:615 start_codon:yes stop_codon:yes gene_type:complete
LKIFFQDLPKFAFKLYEKKKIEKMNDNDIRLKALYLACHVVYKTDMQCFVQGLLVNDISELCQMLSLMFDVFSHELCEEVDIFCCDNNMFRLSCIDISNYLWSTEDDNLQVYDEVYNIGKSHTLPTDILNIVDKEYLEMFSTSALRFIFCARFKIVYSKLCRSILLRILSNNCDWIDYIFIKKLLDENLKLCFFPEVPMVTIEC